MKQKKIPGLLKWIFTAFILVLVPAYWIKYGPANFLWFSDIALILAYLSVMFENRLCASMAILGTLAFELFWNLNFFLQLFFDIRLSELTDYMFDQELPLWLRLLSLFHVVLPVLLIYLIVKLGYARRAWLLQILLAWIVLSATWALTDPSQNINWVYSYQRLNISALPYLLLEFFIFAIAIALTHMIFLFWNRKKD